MRRWIAGALLTLLVAISPAAATGMAQVEPAWALLGPLEPRGVLFVAPSPDWPADPFLIALRGDYNATDLVRSADGGLTWDLLPAPTDHLTALQVARLGDGSRAIFALRGPDPYEEIEQGLFRSADNGDTWQQVFALPPGDERPVLTLSPNFAVDGLGYLVADNRLFRSVDGGLTWEPLVLSTDQHVQQVAFSPNFANDQFLVLAVSSAEFPDLGNDQPYDQPSNDHELSVGLLVESADKSAWVSLADGLQVDGVPYRHVQSLAISPTFAQDGTLFVYAWGPRIPGPFIGDSVVRHVSSGLFRSLDRGATWSLVKDLSRHRVSIAISPTHDLDGVVTLAASSAGLSPASHTCSLFFTADNGATWQEQNQGSYQGCAHETQLARAEGLVFAFNQKSGGWFGLVSADGLSWTPLDLQLSPVFESLPVAIRGQTLFVGGLYGGIQALGPGLQSTLGRFPCAADPVRGFGTLWSADPWYPSRLGCPMEAERAVQIRELYPTEMEPRAYWTDDAEAHWFQLYDYGSWGALAKEDNPWVHVDRIVSGAAQRFQSGLMLWIPQSEGPPLIVTLVDGFPQEWREVREE